MSDFKTLSDIEKEILLVLSDGKSYWTKCYQLMRIVEKEQLYLEANYRSFTAWLNAFQYKAGVNIRILWQQKKAGSFYESYRRKNKEKIKDLPDIDTVRITPTNLNYIEKISESHPWLEDNLMKRAIEGNVSRRELKNTWDSIKAERIAKGEMVARATRHDKKMIASIVEQKISSTKALLCIQSEYKWLTKGKNASNGSKYHVYANYEIEHGENIYQWDILIAETVTSKNKDIKIHGLFLLKDESSIDRNHIDEYSSFVDYNWVIVTDHYKETEKIPDTFGILEIHFNVQKEGNIVLRAPKEKMGIHRFSMISDLLLKFLKSAD